MGLVIKLNDQNFSGSSLGVITVLPSNRTRAAQITQAYCTAIGSTAYKSAINRLVYQLINSGIYDKMIGIYPILGNSISTLKVNLMSPGTKDIIVGANASAIENQFDFSRTIGTGNVGDPVNLTTNNSFSVLLGSRTKSSTGGCCYLNFWESGTSTKKFQMFTALESSVQKNKLGIGADFGSHVVTFDEANTDNKLWGCAVNVSAGKYLAINNGVYTNGDIYDATRLANVFPNAILGQNQYTAKSTTAGATISANSALANGYVFFYAIGLLQGDENKILSDAANRFVADVKGISTYTIS